MNNGLKINKFLKNNSTTILTVIGSIGVGITAVMSARDTVKAIKRINYQRGYQLKEFNTKEKIKIAAPCYIPTIISGVSTILCICGANKLNKAAQKSLASAYVLLDRSYKEYRNSVKEVYGEDGDSNVIRNIAERMEKETTVSEEDDTNVFFDFFNIRFFNSTIEKIREAEKKANEILKTSGYVSLATLCSLMGENINVDDDVLGWSFEAGKRYGYDDINIVIDEVPRKDGESKYYVVDFVDGPTEDYLY